MRRTDVGPHRRGVAAFVLAPAAASLLLLVPACSSTESGGGGSRGASGGQAGGAGGDIGAGGEAGGAGGGGAQSSELCGVDAHPFAATCAAITNQEDCLAAPANEEDYTMFCFWRTVELLPDMFTCQEGTELQRCMAVYGGASGACPNSCPAEPPSHSYHYCEREDGSVELIHGDSAGCALGTPPPGFTLGKMQEDAPEAYLCRCRL